MKSIIFVTLALAAVTLAAPVDKEPTKILRSEFEQQPQGAYRLLFETDDGTVRQEEGELKSVVDEENKPQNVIVVRGSYSYVNPNGVQETITFFADETGFHADGPSIPKLARR